jgi:hypothetical protein
MAINQKPLTPRQRKLAKRLLQGMSSREAIKGTGYSTKNPTQSVQQAINGPGGIALKMPELMDKIGMTDQRLLSGYLQPLLEATETKFFHYQGKIVSTRKVEALGTRSTALDMAFKLKGSYAPTKLAAADAGDSEGVRVIVIDVPRPSRKAIDVEAKEVDG